MQKLREIDRGEYTLAVGPASGRWLCRFPSALRAQSRRVLCGTLLTLAAFASASCANDEQVESSRQVWVGAVQDSDLMVGVVQAGNAASLFVCGGPSSFATQTRWFSSPIGLDSPFSLAAGGLRLEGTTSADSIEGVLQEDASDPGDARSFSARPVDNASLAGVYDAFGPCGHLGLIIQPSSPGEPAAAQGACLRVENGAQIVEQVNPVMPLARDANAGVAVTVGAELFILHPLVPAGS